MSKTANNIITPFQFLLFSLLLKTTEGINNETDTEGPNNDLSTGQIVGIAIGSLTLIAITAILSATGLSCCTVKRRETTKTSLDGTIVKEVEEERGSAEVANKIAGIAVDSAVSIKTVLTHSTATVSNKPSSSSPSKSNYGSTSHNNSPTVTTTSTIDTASIIIAVKADIADGDADGNKVVEAAKALLQIQRGLGEIEFLEAQVNKQNSPSGAVSDKVALIDSPAPHSDEITNAQLSGDSNHPD